MQLDAFYNSYIKYDCKSSKMALGSLRIVMLGISGPIQLIYKRMGLLGQL